MTTLQWFQYTGTSAAAVLGILALIRTLFQPLFDKNVLNALARESGAWKELSTKHFPELFKNIETGEETARKLEAHSEELLQLSNLVKETIQPLASLPGEVRILSQTVKNLTRAVERFDDLSERVAILSDRANLRGPIRSKRREPDDKEDVR